MQIIFWSGTKCVTATIHKKNFGLAQKISGPVKGQDIRSLFTPKFVSHGHGLSGKAI